MVGDEGAIEGRNFLGRHAHLLARTDARREPVDDVPALDERTASRLLPIVNKAYDDIGAVAKDAGESRRELRRLIEAGSNDAQAINALIDRLVGNKMRVDQLETEMFRDVRKVLTPLQLARLVLILPEINRELQQQVRRAAKGEGPEEP